MPRAKHVLLLVSFWIAIPAGDAAAACPPVVSSYCRSAERSSIDLRRDVATPAKNAVRWSWTRGTPTLLPGFGTPTSTTAESVCVYDANGLVLATTVPPSGACGGKPCWNATTSGITFKDKAGTHGGVQQIKFRPSAAPRSTIKVMAKGTGVAAAALPLEPPVTVQVIPSGDVPCFASVFETPDIRVNDAARFKATARIDIPNPPPARPSNGCGSATTFAAGRNADALVHDGLTRTFGVYLPASYDLAGTTPAPLLVVLHGGFGSGEQVFESARMQALADATGIVIAYPDGVLSPGGIRTWNAGRCCGYAMSSGIDDVSFVAALLDELEARICVDERRIHATGMSNGAMLSYRLACELSHRIASVGPVAGSDMTNFCKPTRPVPVMQIHGTADMNVPWEGGEGCGPSGATVTSVAASIGGWVDRDACKGGVRPYLIAGDGTCEVHGLCPSGAEVVLCAIAGGGHSWPGGEPPASPGFPSCPFGSQSTTFDATTRLYDFFATHPLQ